MITWMKTFSFTAMHFAIAFAVVSLMTGDVLIGGAVALIEPACNSIGFFFHEKAWTRIAARKRDRATRPGGRGAVAAH